MRRTTVGLATSLALLLVSCTNTPSKPRAEQVSRATLLPAPPESRVTAAAADSIVALRPASDCGELITSLRREASKHVGPYGLPWGGGYDRGPHVLDAFAEAQPLSAEPAAVPQAGRGQSAAFSTTNVQEAGVDEPDTVKTDGRRVFAMIGDRLVAVSIRDGIPRLSGTLTFEGTWGNELLLAGDRLLVMGAEHETRPAQRGSGRTWRARTGIHIVDVSNPATMRVARTLWVEGSYVSARLVDGIVRLVVRTSGVGLTFTYPKEYTPSAERTAQHRNRSMVLSSTLTDWLPRYMIGRGRGFSEARSATLVPCTRVHQPRDFSGMEMVSVLTVDPADPRPREAVTVMGSGETVYSSLTGLYVTTNAWEQTQAVRQGRRVAAAKLTTQIHRFDISDPRRARYVASGTVLGHLLNQFSLSEHEGRLRVATTLQPWDGTESVSQVVVLEKRGSVLARIGSVGGLGKNERIYAVRFIEDLAFVVTFRQTDPLYVIDLSVPTRPVVRGELKIPGFSAYLHPVDEGRLAGVGQDADEEGRQLGVQASIFDVSDPDHPTQADRISIGADHTPVQSDHRAFLWWAPERMMVFPYASYSEGETNGAVALGVDRSGTLSVLGRVKHPATEDQREQGYTPQVERALVIGDSLYTLSSAGMLSSDLKTFADVAWIAWPARAQN